MLEQGTQAPSPAPDGSIGGLKRAEYYGPDVLSEWAAKGGKAVLAKYGREYFVELRKRRMTCFDEIERRKAFESAQTESRSMAVRRNAQRGGLARRALSSAEQRSNWARKGGIATRARYGNAFYREIRKLRKRYRTGYLTRKTKERISEAFQRSVNKQLEDNPQMASLWKFVIEHDLPPLKSRWGHSRMLEDRWRMLQMFVQLDGKAKATARP
jgi:hypothetical protein